MDFHCNCSQAASCRTNAMLWEWCTIFQFTDLGRSLVSVTSSRSLRVGVVRLAFWGSAYLRGVGSSPTWGAIIKCNRVVGGELCWQAKWWADKSQWSWVPQFCLSLVGSLMSGSWVSQLYRLLVSGVICLTFIWDCNFFFIIFLLAGIMHQFSQISIIPPSICKLSK